MGLNARYRWNNLCMPRDEEALRGKEIFSEQPCYRLNYIQTNINTHKPGYPSQYQVVMEFPSSVLSLKKGQSFHLKLKKTTTLTSGCLVCVNIFHTLPVAVDNGHQFLI